MAEQAVPFGGLGDLEQSFEAGDFILMQLGCASGLTVGRLIGKSRFEVREMPSCSTSSGLNAARPGRPSRALPSVAAQSQAMCRG